MSTQTSSASATCQHDGALDPGPCLAYAVAELDQPPRMMTPPQRRQWAASPTVIDAHARGVARFLDALEPPAPGAGRGIVIAAGGIGYFTQAWVCVSVLRRLGCALPVELWYLGAKELDATMIELVRPLGVTCVDAFALARALPRPPRLLGGWELKAFAMLHCRFAEVLFLDADNVPTRDPTELFDGAEYREHGAILWPDLPPGQGNVISDAAWRSVGLAPRPHRACESGQILVDKRRCGRELALAGWINDHSDHFYRHVYGDKDTFALAWARTERSFAMPATPRWHEVTILQHDFAGRVVFQHRCGDKWRFRGDNRRIDGFVHEDWCLAARDELRLRWDGALWPWSQLSAEERRLGERAAGVYAYRHITLGSRLLGLLPDGVVGSGVARSDLERWAIHVIDGAPALLLGGAGRSRCLRLGPDGVWAGARDLYEGDEVTLCRRGPTWSSGSR